MGICFILHVVRRTCAAQPEQELMAGFIVDESPPQDKGVNRMEMLEVRIWLKACPKCRGDLFSSWGSEGDYLECLQCGRILYGVEEQIARLVELRSRDAASASWSARSTAHCAA